VGEPVVVALVDPGGDDLLNLHRAPIRHLPRVPHHDYRLDGLAKNVIVEGGEEVGALQADQRFRTTFETFQKLLARVEDASERRRLEAELWELALVDDLTGLHNRRSFMLLAEQALKEAARAQRPLITLFLDVDNLKAINDTHGHAEGDRALRLIAGALRAACRGSDIIGRLSGDEFAIVLAEAHEVDGLEGRVRCRVAEAAQQTSYPLSVSIGVGRCEPGEDCDLAELFERADQAMYADKASKRRPQPRE
jgi:diguanylate cyclase (GGDEF)-like protein